MNKLLRLGLEAILAGILVVVLGTIAGFILGRLMSTDLPPVCKNWNKNYVMEISLFLTGIALHLVCELVGINALYCKHGVACN